MAIGAGDLDKRITVMGATLQAGDLSDDYTYAEAKKVWAKVTFISDGEKFRAGATVANLAVRFIMRRTTINHTDRLVYDGRTYEVIGIKEIDKFFIEVTGGNTK